MKVKTALTSDRAPEKLDTGRLSTAATSDHVSYWPVASVSAPQRNAAYGGEAEVPARAQTDAFDPQRPFATVK